MTNLPEDANESLVSNNFIASIFLEALGFSNTEIIPQYSTGQGPVDFATRRNRDRDVFITTQTNPFLLVELKGRNVNLSSGSRSYISVVKQLKRYLLGNQCKSAKWGLITNANHIQLFRKHGKVIYPATQVLEITPETIVNITQIIRRKIAKTKRALTVAVYNNKGGVGKTTTTVNLAGALTLKGKKVLVVDFDPNQQDLTNSLGIDSEKSSLSHNLFNKNNNPDLNLVCEYIKHSPKTNKEYQFDVIPADSKLVDLGEDKLRQQVKLNRLSQILEPFKNKYDYILIDAPPNWRFYSQSAVFAADVVLIPTKPNNIFSLENAGIAIAKFIPETQKARKDGCPVALPIFFNGEKISDSQKKVANKAIEKIIKNHRQTTGNSFDLLPYFFPKHTKATPNPTVFEIQPLAHIASASFERLPASYKYKRVRDEYNNLAKEYFLNE
ncbi:MAG: AAA family ATPase [Jaaginema sp. PMC 1080.18]|nr:AAA family ATPase [Jaaginema sp. PMC 1080.18]